MWAEFLLWNFRLGTTPCSQQHAEDIQQLELRLSISQARRAIGGLHYEGTAVLEAYLRGPQSVREAAAAQHEARVVAMVARERELLRRIGALESQLRPYPSLAPPPPPLPVLPSRHSHPSSSVPGALAQSVAATSVAAFAHIAVIEASRVLEDAVAAFGHALGLANTANEEARRVERVEWRGLGQHAAAAALPLPDDPPSAPGPHHSMWVKIRQYFMALVSPSAPPPGGHVLAQDMERFLVTVWPYDPIVRPATTAAMATLASQPPNAPVASLLRTDTASSSRRAINLATLATVLPQQHLRDLRRVANPGMIVEQLGQLSTAATSRADLEEALERYSHPMQHAFADSRQLETLILLLQRSRLLPSLDRQTTDILALDDWLPMRDLQVTVSLAAMEDFMAMFAPDP